MSDQRLGKEYKLCSKKLIEELFTSGTTLKQYPIRLLYKRIEKTDPHQKPFQIVFAVPKKKLKHAHDRNYIKRVFREIFRKNKLELEKVLLEKNINLSLFAFYTEKEILEFSTIEKKTVKLIQQLIQTIKNDEN